MDNLIKEELRLTEREKEVIFFAAKGYSNPEIAKELFISTHTVKAHMENICKKLHVHNKIQAVIKALQNNILLLQDIKI